MLHLVTKSLVVALLGGPLVLAAETETHRPNIVFILADDCSYNSLGCYGGRNVPTPNIDRLAAEGMRFTRAYASTSMCVSLRHELYTGLYPMRNGSVWNHSATRPGTPNVVREFRALGYRVGITGKRHFYPSANFPFERVPGFETNCVAQQNRYQPEKILPFLTRDSGQPFCLFVCSTNPHRPWTMGDASRFDAEHLKLPPALADTPVIREQYTRYLAEVAELDRQVGDVLQMLKQQGLFKNTLVMFSSEQGWQFPGGKWNAWDLSLHTALLARWPGHIQPGQISDALVQICDILPTLLAAAGGNPEAVDFDGRSFLSVLSGQRSEHRKIVFGMHNNIPEGEPYPMRTARGEHFRLVLNLEPERTYIGKYINGQHKSAWFDSLKAAAAEGDSHAKRLEKRLLHRPAEEFYHTAVDPYELNNLAEDPRYAKEKAALYRALREWMEAQGDPGAEIDRQRKLDENRAAFGWNQ